MHRKILGLLFVLLFVLSGCIPKGTKPDLYNTIIQRDRLIVGTSYDSKPFSFKDTDGQIKGFEPDLAREIAKRMLGSRDKVIFQDIKPQDRVLAAMSRDTDIVISTMTITPDRQKLVNFSNPYFVAGQVICAKKGSKIDTVDDLLNKRIIVILGTTGEENIRRFAPNALIWSFVDNSEAIEAFKTTNANAITTDDSLLQGLALSSKEYIILPTRLTKEPYGIAFERTDRAETFRNQLNNIINDMLNDGTLDILKEKWGIS